jgi:predicted SprT family Zn-dependent metalloprotease
MNLQIKKKLKNSLFGIAVILVGLLSYEILWGKLFPYSTIFIGFTKHELSNTVIYTQNGVEYKDFVRIDTLIPSVENFHELKFLSKPKIFIFRDSSNYIHRSLSNARFCTYYNGSIEMSPWALNEAMNGKISLEIYLRHELSHSLLHQHNGILNAHKYPKWLAEGFAMYSANQMGTSLYPSKEKTYELIQQGNFMPPSYFRTNKEHKVKIEFKNNVAFMYSEFACIVDYLVITYGKEKVLKYIKRLLDNCNNKEVFIEEFGIDFYKVTLNFKKYVMDNVASI